MVKRGRTREIREFVKAHPNCSTADIRTGLNLDAMEVTRELSRLVKSGQLVAQDQHGQRRRYIFGREPLHGGGRIAAPKPPKPPKDHPLRNEPAAAHRRPLNETFFTKSAPTVAARPKPAQTVEEFIANGGTVQVIEAHWDSPTRYPEIGLPSKVSRKSGAL